MYNNKNKWHVLLKFIAKIHMQDQLRDFLLIEFELYYLLFDIPFMLIFLFRHTTFPIIRTIQGYLGVPALTRSTRERPMQQSYATCHNVKLCYLFTYTTSIQYNYTITESLSRFSIEPVTSHCWAKVAFPM